MDVVLDSASARPGALCAQTDPELFFPPKGGSPRAAKLICARCEHLEDCREEGLRDTTAEGIMGGLTERERGRIRAQRAAEEASE